MVKKRIADEIPKPSRVNAWLGAFLFFFVFLLNLTWIRDADTWMHLKTGEWIWNFGIPRMDPFSYVLQGKPWITFEWLSQTLFFKFFQLWGPVGLTGFKALVVAGAFCMLWCLAQYSAPGTVREEVHLSARRLRLDRALWSTCVLGLAALSLRVFFVERPFIFDWFFLAWFCSALWNISFRAPPAHLRWSFPLATALWANLHGGAAVLSPVLLALAVSAQWSQDRHIPVRFWLSVILGCVLALLANPHGAGILVHLARTLNFPAKALITEWHPPTSYHYLGLYGLFLLGALGASFLVFKRKPFMVAWVLALAVASMLSQRHIPLFTLAASAMFLEIPLPQFFTRAGPAASSILCFFLAGAAWAHSAYGGMRSPRFGFGLEEPLAGAAAFLDRAGISGTMFNEYDSGGYLLWKAAPRRPVFIDGRSLEYGPELLSLAMAWYRPEYWRELESRYRFNYAVIRRHESGAYTARVLDELSHWKLVYWDDGAMVYIRRAPKNEMILRRYGYDLLKPGHAHYQYLEAIFQNGLSQKLLAELDTSLREAPNCMNALLMKAYVLARLGRMQEAVKTARQGILARPQHVQPYLTLGWVYAVSRDYARAQEAYQLGLRRIRFPQKATVGADLLNNLGRVREKLGDLKQARDYYRKSLRWNPAQGDARHNLARLGIR